MLVKSFINFQTLTAQLVKLRNRLHIFPTILWVCDYLSMLSLKLIHVSRNRWFVKNVIEMVCTEIMWLTDKHSLLHYSFQYDIWCLHDHTAWDTLIRWGHTIHNICAWFSTLMSKHHERHFVDDFSNTFCWLKINVSFIQMSPEFTKCSVEKKASMY